MRGFYFISNFVSIYETSREMVSVMIRYIIATLSQISIEPYVRAMISCPLRVSSSNPITETSDESFNKAINSLPNGGITRLNACGIITNFIVCVQFNPRERPASI